MRSKMSPRRALATAAIMAVVPSSLVFIGIKKNSEQVCNQFAEKIEAPISRKQELEGKYNKEIANDPWVKFYLILLFSSIINWPIIRWLDDLQWYSEWLDK